MTPQNQMTLFYTYPDYFALRKDPAHPISKGIQVEDNWYLLLKKLCRHLRAHLVPLQFTRIDKENGQLRIDYVMDSSSTDCRLLAQHCVEFTYSLTLGLCDTCGNHLEPSDVCSSWTCPSNERKYITSGWNSPVDDLPDAFIGEIEAVKDKLPGEDEDGTPSHLHAADNMPRPYFSWEQKRPGSPLWLASRDNAQYMIDTNFKFNGEEGWVFVYTLYVKEQKAHPTYGFLTGHYEPRHTYWATHKPKSGTSVLTDEEWINVGLVACESILLSPMELLARGVN